MPGYYPMAPREPVPMAQVYPPARCHSLAKLNYPHHKDYGLYEKVKVGKPIHGGDRRPPRMFEQLRRQQSYDGDLMTRMKHHSQPRRPEGFDSLQLLGPNNDDRYLDRFMDSTRGRPSSRETVEPPPKTTSKSTLFSIKSSNSKNSANKNNKENNKRSSTNVSTEILALIGSLANSASVDNLYESVEQIHYRKTVESMNRRKKVQAIHRTGHPLFDHLREERALATLDDADVIYTSNNNKQRVSRSAGPSRKVTTVSSPNLGSNNNNSSGDEHDNIMQRTMNRRSSTMPMPHHHQKQQQLQHQRYHQQQQGGYPAPAWRTGSAGSESDDEWVIPRPKITSRRRESRTLSTDESDSSSKSSPVR